MWGLFEVGYDDHEDDEFKVPITVVKSNEPKEQKKMESKGFFRDLFDLGVDLTINAGKFVDDVITNPFDNIIRANGLLNSNRITRAEFQSKKRGYIKKLKYYPFDSYEAINKGKSLLDTKIINEDDYQEIKKLSIKKLHSRNLESLNLEEEIKKINNLKSTGAVSKEEYKSLIKPYDNELKKRKEEEKIKRENEKKEVDRLEYVYKDPGYTEYIKEEKERNERESERRVAIYKRLEESGDEVLIKNLVKRYDDGQFDAVLFNKDCDKLKELLNLKGYGLTNENFHLIVGVYAIDRDNQNFKERIFFNSPKDLDQILSNYVEFYGIDSKYIEKLRMLLKNEGYKINSDKLVRKLEKLIKERELLEFERSLLTDESPFTIYEIDKLSGSEFESFIKILFEKMGYEAHKTKDSGDQGADVIVDKFGQKSAVQAKRWDNKVNNKAIQEITAAIKYYNADEGIVITNNTFTISAIELAKSNNIKLIDREKLENLLKKYPITKKVFD